MQPNVGIYIYHPRDPITFWEWQWNLSTMRFGGDWTPLHHSLTIWLDAWVQVIQLMTWFFPKMVSLVTVYTLKRLNQTVGKYTSPMDGMGQRGPGDYFIKPWHKDPYQTRIWWFKFHHTLKSYEFLVFFLKENSACESSHGGRLGHLDFFWSRKTPQQNWGKEVWFFSAT